jgi:hypothetical protein
VTGLTFNATASPTPLFSVTGLIDEAGAPLTQTEVRATAIDGGVISSGLTDGRGAYALANVPEGQWTVSPFKPGFTFTPATRLVEIDGGSVTGQDFSVQGANARPFIVVPPSATPIPIIGTTADLFVLADDPAPGSEAELTYTWSRPFGPAPVMFPNNGTNGAKNVTVTFTRAFGYLAPNDSGACLGSCGALNATYMKNGSFAPFPFSKYPIASSAVTSLQCLPPSQKPPNDRSLGLHPSGTPGKGLL